MKKLFSILMVTLLTLSLSAHNILRTSTCWQSGQFTFNGTQFDKNENVKLVVTSGYHFSNGLTSLLINTGNATTFTVVVSKNTPYVGAYNVTLTCTYGGSNGTNTAAVNSPISSTTTICTGGGGGLPVKLINFAVKKNTDFTTSVSWTTTFESNNSFFTVEGSNDGKDFHTQAVVFSQSEDGNADGITNYSYKIEATTVSKLILAGSGLVGSIVLLLILVGTMRRKRSLWAVPFLIIAFSASFVSCKKDVSTYDKSSVKWKYVRLKQTDKDGTTVIATNVQVVNN